MRGFFHRMRGGLSAPRLGRRSRAVLFSLLGLAAVTAASGVALFTFPLPAFLFERPLVNAIEQRLGSNYSVKIGEAIVDAGGGGLDLRLNAFEIRDSAGTPVLRVPSATVALDGNLIFGSQLGLRRIRLAEPRLVLRVDDAGNVAFAGAEDAPPLFSLSGSTAPRGAPAELLGFLAAGGAMLNPDGALANFESAEITRGLVIVDDQRRGRVERIENVDIKIAQRADGEGLVASASSSDPENRWSVTATLEGKAGNSRDLDVGFQNIPLDRVVYESVGAPADISGQLFGHLYARVDPDGSVPSAEARVEAAGLRVAPSAQPDAAIAVDRGRVQLEWIGAERRWRIGPADIQTGDARLALLGEARPAGEAGMVWNFNLEGSERGSAPAAQRIEALQISGTIDRAAHRIDILDARLRGETIKVAGKGSLSFATGTPQIDVALAVADAPVSTLTRAWPAPVAYSARKWLLDHVSEGTIQNLSVAVRGALGHGLEEQRSVVVDAAFTGGTIAVIEGMPPATGASGRVSVVDRALTVQASGGRVDAGNGKTIDLNGVTFKTENLGDPALAAQIVSQVDGPIGAFATLLQRGPMKAVAVPAQVLANASGTFEGEVRLSGTLGPSPTPNALDMVVKGDLRDVASSLPSDLDLRKGNFRLEADPAGISLRGEAELSGAPLVIEGLVARNPDRTLGAVSAAFTVDPAKVKGLTLGDIELAGPVSARVSLPKSPSLDGGRIEADISGASLDGPPGLEKDAGKAGSVAFDVTQDEGRYRLSSFVAQGDGFEMRGTIDLSDSGEFRSARFSPFKLSKSDDARLDVDRTGSGYKVTARGSTLDVRDLLRDILAGEEGRKALDLDLDAKLGTVLGHNGEAIAGLELKVARRSSEIRSVQLSGHLGRGPIEGRSIEGAAQRLGIRSADAGAVFRFFDVYTRIQGGQMQLEFTPGDPARGFLGISEFRVAGEQALASMKGAQQNPSRGYSFSKMRAIFRQVEGRIIVDDATVWGPDLGATIEGEINYAKDRIDVRGTFVPAYALNNIFGRLPIIGNFLGGAQEGLVGITYQVDGPIASPQLRVNPLSAVAPGFLRKLFEFRDNDQAVGRPSQ